MLWPYYHRPACMYEGVHVVGLCRPFLPERAGPARPCRQVREIRGRESRELFASRLFYSSGTGDGALEYGNFV